jgi:hypothetical protein
MDADLVAAAAFKAVVGQRELSWLGSIPRRSRHIQKEIAGLCLAISFYSTIEKLSKLATCTQNFIYPETDQVTSRTS